MITVCKNFFMHLTRVKATRLHNIAKRIRQNKSLREARGGDRTSNKSVGKKIAVREFLRKLKGQESHYSRKKSKRIYLQSDLNMTKLYKMYNNSVGVALQVKKSMFRRVFCEFNIGFKSPASDICCYCNKIDLQLKKEKSASPEKRNVAVISDLILKKRVHKVRAKAFYGLMREKRDNEIKVCFDLQQVQSLPKSPVQEAFYLRQLSFYAFCVVDIKAEKTVFYTWTEDQSGRGSKEVSSALFNYLKNIDLTDVKTIRLFCDGCGAQNKNNIVVQTLLYFLGTHTCSVEEIQITFPVRGHSFLPADRVFGRVEKMLRKKPTIANREEYYSVYEEVGEVRKLGEHWTILNTKSLSTRFKTIDHISHMQRIAIKKEIETIQRRSRTITVTVPVIKVKALKTFDLKMMVMKCLLSCIKRAGHTKDVLRHQLSNYL